ncbi:MAG: hypothetical protein M0Q12_00185 [Synergistaceae bacterium]|jgi:hypothetical protein|nr:hypothetical protein [Synergistaceae bacterium]
MEGIYCLAGLSAVIAIIVFYHLWKHEWDWKEAGKDLTDGSITRDIEAERKVALKFAKRAEEIGQKAKQKKKPQS